MTYNQALEHRSARRRQRHRPGARTVQPRCGRVGHRQSRPGPPICSTAITSSLAPRAWPRAPAIRSCRCRRAGVRRAAGHQLLRHGIQRADADQARFRLRGGDAGARETTCRRSPRPYPTTTLRAPSCASPTVNTNVRIMTMRRRSARITCEVTWRLTSRR